MSEHAHYSTDELIQTGKPLYIESPSSTGAIMEVKESLWKAGKEFIHIEADLIGPDDVTSIIGQCPDETILIISDVLAASDEVKEAVRANLGAPKKLVIADRKGLSKEDKKVFTDLGGHVASF